MQSYANISSLSPSPTRYKLSCPLKVKQQCSCKIISITDPKTTPKHRYFPAATINTENEFKFLNIISDTNEISYSPTDTPQEFFQVGSMWDFDNIGVSRPTNPFTNLIELKQPGDSDSSVYVQFSRFLVCADCDKGPLGFAGYLIKDPSGWSVSEHHNSVAENGEGMVYYLAVRSCLYE